ncbi:hypothetical protein [Azospirillum palustre]
MDPLTVGVVSVGVSLGGLALNALAQSRARAADAMAAARKDERQSAKIEALERQIADLSKRADLHDSTREELSVLKQVVTDVKAGMQRMEAGLGSVQSGLQDLMRALAQSGFGRRSADRASAE